MRSLGLFHWQLCCIPIVAILWLSSCTSLSWQTPVVPLPSITPQQLIATSTLPTPTLPVQTPTNTQLPEPALPAIERISRPGEYQGYSKPLYTEWMKTSLYLTMRDGTKLASDILRPSHNNRPVDTPLPVVWTHHRYHTFRVILL